MDLAAASSMCRPWAMINCVEAGLRLRYLHFSVHAGPGVSLGPALKADSAPLPCLTLLIHRIAV